MRDFFKSIGLDISFIIIGILSAFIMMKDEKHREKTFLEKLAIWASGFGFAVFVTPLVIWIVEISLSRPMPAMPRWGVCFLCAKFGEEIIKLVIRADWKSIWEVLKSIKLPTLKK